MKNVAYKVSKGNPNLPDGFITEHFETDQDVEEGCIIVSNSTFSVLLENNVSLFRSFEASKGIVTADPNATPPPLRPASDAQPINQEIMAQKQAEMQQSIADAELFKQFLAWKKSQGQ